MAPPPGYGSKTRLIAFLPEDTRNFSLKLVGMFPGVRFVPSNFDQQEALPEKKLPWADTLAGDGGNSSVEAWIVPEGWRPRWQSTSAEDGGPCFRLANKPMLSFVYPNCVVGKPDFWCLREEQIWSYYRKSDSAHVAFLRKVWGVIEGVASNELDSVYDDTGQIIGSKRTRIWAGKHALEWCRADPMRRIGSDLRPRNSRGAPIPQSHWHAYRCENPQAAPNYESLRKVAEELRQPFRPLTPRG